MSSRTAYDAIVVGSGPNGLAAGIVLARAGYLVKIFEARETIGGGMRSAEWTLPGFIHDVCSAIHPLGAGSPFFKTLPLADHGLEWIFPPASLAHPLDDGTAAVLEHSVEATAHTLGVDAAEYKKLMNLLIPSWNKLAAELLGPLRLPRHPLELARFGWRSIRSARAFAESFFQGVHARALFAGLAGHAILPLEELATAAFGLILGVLGHTVGWPIPKGGSQTIADALASYFQSLGGEIVTATLVRSIDELPAARAVLFDVTPQQLLQIAGRRFSSRYRRKLERYRYGSGVFKMDWALNGPIPWKAGDCARASTVHVGGTLEEIAAAEQEVGKGDHPEKPFVLVAQQSLFDPLRAPSGKHTAWAYCHVPHGSTVDMTERIEAQIERFAPGFKDCILARHAFSTRDFERYNPNYIGGDINGGVQDIWQLFSRPAGLFRPYSTSAEGIYICSSSTPPGGGVHGMCGYHAAKAALRECFYSSSSA